MSLASTRPKLPPPTVAPAVSLRSRRLAQLLPILKGQVPAPVDSNGEDDDDDDGNTPAPSFPRTPRKGGHVQAAPSPSTDSNECAYTAEELGVPLYKTGGRGYSKGQLLGGKMKLEGGLWPGSQLGLQ